MNILSFIKEKQLNILWSIVIFVTINVYLITLNSFKNNIFDLIYMDIIIISLYFIYTFIDYRKWIKRYYEIYKLYSEGKQISLDDIKENSFEEKIMTYIIESKSRLFEENLKASEEKLNDMEEYISKWVHEIKLPISAINLILERIEDDEIYDRIKNENMKISFLVNSIMYGSRSTASSEDIFINEENLNDIVKESLKNNAFFLIKNKMDVDIKNLNFNVYTDKKWMGYVLDQIIHNSIKYSKGNGTLKFYGRDEDKYIELCIEDNGIGIAKEDIGRIFDKGFTGKNGRNTIYKSTGMGLYFVKKIIDKLEHDILIESECTKFTIFKIRFYKVADYLNAVIHS